jgi:hypothetical protein
MDAQDASIKQQSPVRSLIPDMSPSLMKRLVLGRVQDGVLNWVGSK